jgi:hypothetical protein
MKKYFFAIWAFLALASVVQGQQVPNAGFEVWTNQAQPDAWYTFSSGGFVNLASKDLSEKVEGIASAKIQTASFSGQTTYEILSLGSAMYQFGIGYTYKPVYFPFRPDTLVFAYKYSSPGVDTATAYIKLMKGNRTLAETEIALTKTSQWTFPSVLLTALYSNADIPDSLLIQFKSSKLRRSFFGVDGSTLHVDAVHLGYVGAPSSASEFSGAVNARVFPSPFSDQLTFAATDNVQTTVSVYDGLGREVLQGAFTNTVTFSTAHLQSGMYIYALKRSDGKLKIGKLVKL